MNRKSFRFYIRIFFGDWTRSFYILGYPLIENPYRVIREEQRIIIRWIWKIHNYMKILRSLKVKKKKRNFEIVLMTWKIRDIERKLKLKYKFDSICRVIFHIKIMIKIKWYTYNSFYSKLNQYLFSSSLVVEKCLDLFQIVFSESSKIF